MLCTPSSRSRWFAARWVLSIGRWVAGPSTSGVLCAEWCALHPVVSIQPSTHGAGNFHPKRSGGFARQTGGSSFYTVGERPGSTHEWELGKGGRGQPAGKRQGSGHSPRLPPRWNWEGGLCPGLRIGQTSCGGRHPCQLLSVQTGKSPVPDSNKRGLRCKRCSTSHKSSPSPPSTLLPTRQPPRSSSPFSSAPPAGSGQTDRQTPVLLEFSQSVKIGNFYSIPLLRESSHSAVSLRGVPAALLRCLSGCDGAGEN